MAVIMTVTITYDMAEETRSLSEELERWLNGSVTVKDVMQDGIAFNVYRTSAWSGNWSAISIKDDGLIDRKGSKKTSLTEKEWSKKWYSWW